MHVTVKFKKLEPDALAPTKAHDHDSGYDLYAHHDVLIPARQNINIYTGIAICTPPGWGYTIRGRSSLNKKGVQTSLGTVDPQYSGPLYALLFNTTDNDYIVEAGHKIAQIVFERIYDIDMIEVDEFKLPATARGSKGFGSSGL